MVRILIVFVAAIIVIAGYLVYQSVTYIDAQYTEGEAYGFKIGDSKNNVYQVAGKEFNKEKVYILYPLDKNNHGPHRQITFGSEEFQLVKDRDIWTLYFNEGFFDFLKLKFENGALISIHRHRKKFELP